MPSPVYSKTTEAQKAAIDKFGSRAKFLGGPIVETITDLLLMWGKDCNIESVYGYGNHSGYDSSLTPTAVIPTFTQKPSHPPVMDGQEPK